MPRGIPRIRTEAEGDVAVAEKPRFYICTEAFVVTLYDNAEDEAIGEHGHDTWFVKGQRVHESNPVFKGPSGRNRQQRLFLPEGELP